MIKQMIGLVCGVALAAPVWAHHSAARFDFGKSVMVEGVVKEFLVNNPHTKVVLEVTDEKGTRDIEFEGHSRNNVYRRGWRPNLVHEGDQITITIAPTRDGSDGGYVTAVTAKDGTEF
ncbi:MAG: hypothetical protein H6978_13585 [Gammaproteobacteria bacterium]|nr:hypothetical protein [Gammaproteobacteria bacterium]